MPGSDVGLRPLTGSPREIEPLVAGWLSAADTEPVWVRTSGSSGEPKDVMLSAQALRASATATIRRLGGPGQWVLALPAHYVAGLQVIVRSMLAGTSPVVRRRPRRPGGGDRRADGRAPLPGDRSDPAAPVAATTTRASTHCAATTQCCSAGPRRAEPDLAAARAAGVAIVTTYGMSETCGGCVYDGMPLDGVAVALGAGGRIRLAGPVLFDGYAGRPDLTAEVLQDGWLTTSDIGELDADGLLDRARASRRRRGVGRRQRAACRRRGGRAACPGVAGCAVVGLPDAEWGEVVVRGGRGRGRRTPG